MPLKCKPPIDDVAAMSGMRADELWGLILSDDKAEIVLELDLRTTQRDIRETLSEKHRKATEQIEQRTSSILRKSPTNKKLRTRQFNERAAFEERKRFDRDNLELTIASARGAVHPGQITGSRSYDGEPAGLGGAATGDPEGAPCNRPRDRLLPLRVVSFVRNSWVSSAQS
jgi:hypothetical protein